MQDPHKHSGTSFIWFDDRGVMSGPPIGRLPSLSIACAPTCDFACPHCIYNTPIHSEESGMSLHDKLHLVREASRLGCRFLQICHDGEPLLDPTTLPLLREAHGLGLKTFMFTHGGLITAAIAAELFRLETCLGVKCDSLSRDVFTKMIGVPRADRVYQGIEHLLAAGYGTPRRVGKRLVTRLSLVCTVTELNVSSVKDVARFCWANELFFNLARLERGGRAVQTWEALRVKDVQRLRDLVLWCSEQTGIDYRYAQPDAYCLGPCGLQLDYKGNAWLTKQGCGCDLTEPDGVTYPEVVVMGNAVAEGLPRILDRVWDYRRGVASRLGGRMQEYLANVDSDSNILAACGGSRTQHLFRIYNAFVTEQTRGGLAVPNEVHFLVRSNEGGAVSTAAEVSA